VDVDVLHLDRSQALGTHAGGPPELEDALTTAAVKELGLTLDDHHSSGTEHDDWEPEDEERHREDTDGSQRHSAHKQSCVVLLSLARRVLTPRTDEIVELIRRRYDHLVRRRWR